MRHLFTNCYLAAPDLELEGAALLVDGDIINAVIPAGTSLPDADVTHDVQGSLTVPGFIDIHCHGRGGADICDATSEAFDVIGQGKLAEGVTGFLATTLTVGVDQLEAAFRAGAEYMRNPSGARLLGMHLEGPFITPSCAGAQNPAFLRLPDIALVDRLNAICPIRKLSFSPELPGGLAFARELVQRGIMPSGAHSTADYELFLAAREAGMKHLTHFCNVMTPLHHLRFGMVGGGLRFPDIFVEIIADGIHLCPEMIDLIFAVKGATGVMLISDAMRGAAMPDGDYELGGLAVRVDDGKAQLEDGTVAGSTLQLHRALRRVHDITRLPMRELTKTTGWNQARSLRLGKLGCFSPGAKADMVILDDEFEPTQVWLDGECRIGAVDQALDQEMKPS